MQFLFPFSHVLCRNTFRSTFARTHQSLIAKADGEIWQGK